MQTSDNLEPREETNDLWKTTYVTKLTKSAPFSTLFTEENLKKTSNQSNNLLSHTTESSLTQFVQTQPQFAALHAELNDI